MQIPSDNGQAHCRCARAEPYDAALSLRDNPQARAQNQHRLSHISSFEAAAQLEATHGKNGKSSASAIDTNSRRNPTTSRGIVGHQGFGELS